MATTTTTTTAHTGGNDRLYNGVHIKPNVRPHGIEVVPDTNWRDWRMRLLRPELNEMYPEMWPPVNPALHARAIEEIARRTATDPPRKRGFHPRSLKDLKGHQATQLQFVSLEETNRRVEEARLTIRPRKEYREVEYDKLPPFWFEELSSDLFARVWEFAADTFGHKDWAGLVYEDDWTKHWLRKLPAEFVRSASVVARGDRLRGAKPGQDEHGYEHLFLHRNSRVYTCTAVIAKLLQENCFDSLLFGATDMQKKTLNMIDRSTDATLDGYARKMARYDTIHRYLTGDLFTSNFWSEVDRVTNGILVILLPLINMIGELDESESVGDERALWPGLTEVHQKLHNIVAEAAWLANGTNFSRSCFWVEFSQPGQLWDIRQEHTTDTNWTESSQAAADLFESTQAMRTWYDNRDAAFQRSGQPDKALEQWTKNVYLPRNPKPRDPARRTAKVQISMWPFFERYFPHHQNTANGGDLNVGDFTNTVQKAQVVYYAGENSDAGDQLEEYTLSQHLSDWETRNTNLVARFFKAAFALFPTRLLAALLWACFALLLLSIAATTFQHGVNRFIHVQDGWLSSHGRNIFGYNGSRPIIDNLWQHRFSRPGSPSHDNSVPQTDVPGTTHPLGADDLKTTGTSIGQAAPNAPEHKKVVVTKIIPYDLSLPVDEPSTRPPSAHDRQLGTEALVVSITSDGSDKDESTNGELPSVAHFGDSDFSTPSRPVHNDKTGTWPSFKSMLSNVKESLLGSTDRNAADAENGALDKLNRHTAQPEALPETFDIPITSDLPGQATGTASEQGLRDESSRGNPPHVSTAESTATGKSKASEKHGTRVSSKSDAKGEASGKSVSNEGSKTSEGTSSGKMTTSDSDGKETKTSRGVTGGKEKVKGKTSEKSVSGNGNTSSQTGVSLDSRSTSKTSTSAQSSSSGADGDANAKTQASADSNVATKIGTRNELWNRIGGLFKSPTSKTSISDESAFSGTTVEQSGKTSTSGNIKVSTKGESNQMTKPNSGTTKVVTEDVTTKTASQDGTSSAGASSSAKWKPGFLVRDPSKGQKPQPPVNSGPDGDFKDDSDKVVDDEKALPGKWIKTQVFGVPYNCWVSAGEATCTQTVTPGSTETGTRAEFTAAGDTNLATQDL